MYNVQCIGTEPMNDRAQLHAMKLYVNWTELGDTMYNLYCIESDVVQAFKFVQIVHVRTLYTLWSCCSEQGSGDLPVYIVVSSWLTA